MAHRTTVGNVEILSLMDVGDWHLPQFFKTVDPATWEAYRAIYPEAQCDGSSICTSATSYVLRTGGKTILVDTGVGPGPHARIGGQEGRLVAEMQASGIAPGDVDLVVVTHLHFDHVGWNATQDGRDFLPTFPNARYLLPQKDWRHYNQAEQREKTPYLDGTRLLYRLGKVDLVDGEKLVTDDVTLLPTPGHTPGHQAVLVQSSGERAVIIGDAAHTPAQVQETDWSPGADVDPVQSSKTRAALFAKVEDEQMLLCAGHFPHPGFGYLTRLEGRRIFKAL